MRTRMPFIEAFTKQQDEKTNMQPVSTEKVERDLSPKTMQESYHKVVCQMICGNYSNVANGEKDIASSERSVVVG